MKKIIFTLFLITFCCGMLFSTNIENPSKVNDEFQDKIDLSKQGGTTRIAGIQSEPIVEAFGSRELVTISVQNYRGGVWVEILGGRDSRHTYFETYDVGFDAINIGNLRPGRYTVRITVGSAVYTGKFNKKGYGR